MSISIVQNPAQVSLAQSPIVFSLNESNPLVVASSSFQYVADLYYWTGSLYASSSVADYTLVKYPNASLNGIFELSQVLNSTLRDLAQANPSNVKNFACDFYYRYYTGNSYVTSSHLKSSTYQALDGYQIFPETIGQSINTLTPYWPVMTDGPMTQSVFLDNAGSGSIYVNVTGGTLPTKLVYSSSIGNAEVFVSQSTNTNQSVANFPLYPTTTGFPLSTIGLTYYTIQPYNDNTPLGTPIKYEIDCIQKYPNIRIKWKNRYGQFDWFNFYMVNKKSFNSTRRTYQPQLGSFQASTLSYNSYDSATLNYIVDSKQAISVNSFWISEDYNDILKELIVSDEIYWVTDEVNNVVKPLTINTNSIQFKTGVVDKVIQYSFDFTYGQNYKLII
jgi:hypothetical protein